MTTDRWKRTSDLFQRALERPREERGEFLRQSCGNDPELMKAVESLLEADEEADVFMEEPLIRPVAESTDPQHNRLKDKDSKNF